MRAEVQHLRTQLEDLIERMRRISEQPLAFFLRLDFLKQDRHGRTLSYDDVWHYQRIIVSLTQTYCIMQEIDKNFVPAFSLKEQQKFV